MEEKAGSPGESLGRVPWGGHGCRQEAGSSPHFHMVPVTWELVSSAVQEKGTETQHGKAWKSMLAPRSRQGIDREEFLGPKERVQLRVAAEVRQNRD